MGNDPLFTILEAQHTCMCPHARNELINQASLCFCRLVNTPASSITELHPHLFHVDMMLHPESQASRECV